MKLIPLSQGYYAKVDDALYITLSQYNWHAIVKYRGPNQNKYVYAARNDLTTRATTYMARQIMDVTDPAIFVDHKDGDTLNNQTYNLHTTETTSRNRARRYKSASPSGTGVRGVSYEKKRGKYRAQVNIDKKQIYLGSFDTLEQAAQAVRAEYETRGIRYI